MSGVDFDLFYEWCVDRFGEENLKMRYTAHGQEICTHSFYAHKVGIEDHKFHLWMNPAGGKKELGGGAYRCWLTDSMGSLISLISDYDNIPYEEAEEIVGGASSLRNLEQRAAEFFGYKEQETEPVVVAPLPVQELPDFSFLIDGMSASSGWKIQAKNYLTARKIPTEGLYVCSGGDFKNRIVIPYFDASGKIVFYNARTMSDNKKILRYMKPPHGEQENVLYMTSWPKPGSKIYIMEGEFDAISLMLSGFVGCACGGKFLSDAQIELIRGYEPVLAFDADASGFEALVNVGNTLLERGFPKIGYIRPPKVYKDWNKLLVERNAQTVKAYIERFEKRYTVATEDVIRLNRL